MEIWFGGTTSIVLREIKIREASVSGVSVDRFSTFQKRPIFQLSTSFGCNNAGKNFLLQYLEYLVSNTSLNIKNTAVNESPSLLPGSFSTVLFLFRKKRT